MIHTTRAICIHCRGAGNVPDPEFPLCTLPCLHCQGHGYVLIPTHLVQDRDLNIMII